MAIKKLDGRSAVNDTNLDRASAQITKAATGTGRKLNESQLNGLVKFLDKALPRLNSPGQRSSPISDSVNFIDALNLKNEAVALLNKTGTGTSVGGGEHTRGGSGVGGGGRARGGSGVGGGERSSGGGGGGGSVGGGER